MRDKVNGRNERSCLGGKGRRREEEGGRRRDFHFDAPKRARRIVLHRAVDKRDRDYALVTYSLSLSFSLLRTCPGE